MRSLSSPLLTALTLAALPTALFGQATLQARGTASIDGVDGAGEWEDAATVTVEFTSGIGGGTSMRTFSLMSDDDNLYVSIRLPLDSALDSDDNVGLIVVARLSGPCPPRPMVDEHQVILDSAGVGHFDLHWTGGSECTWESSALDVDDGGSAEGASGATDEGATVFLEVAIPIDTADDDHDLSASLNQTLAVNVVGLACSGEDCGGPAQAALLFHLELVEVPLFNDGFESRNTLAWSAEAPSLPAPDVFRWTDLDLRDPHVYVNSIGCIDHTPHGALGFSVNDELAASLVTDVDEDGFLDRSHLVVFRPLDPQASEGRLDFGAVRCTEPSPPGSCDWTDRWHETPETFTYLTLTSTGTCVYLPPEYINENYTPPISPPTGPCWRTYAPWAPGTISVDFLGISVPLQSAVIASTFAGDPPDALVNGVFAGFLSETDADAALLPESLPLIGGQPLSILFPGGTGNCAAHDDRDIYLGESGWLVYFNFVASPVPFVGR